METTACVQEENKVVFTYLEKIPFRQKIRQRITEINNYPKHPSPFKMREYYSFFKNYGLQNQSIVYVPKGLDEQPEVFIDPNALSLDGTVA